MKGFSHGLSRSTLTLTLGLVLAVLGSMAGFGVQNGATAAESSSAVKITVVDSEVMVAIGSNFPASAAVRVSVDLEGTPSSVDATTDANGRFVVSRLLSRNFNGVITVTAVSGATSVTATKKVGNGRSSVVINDSAFVYAGKWNAAQGPGKYNSDDHWSTEVGATATVSFAGTRVALYGSKVAGHGIGAIAIDGVEVGRADWNLIGARQDGVLLWTSSLLPNGKHTMTVRVTGERASASSFHAINVDRVVVHGAAGEPVPTTDAPAPTTSTTPSTTPVPTVPVTNPTVPTTNPPANGSKGKVPLVGKSGIAWNSIVFGHGSQPAAFEAWRNRPVDGVLYFPARTTWADMAQLPSRRPGDLMVYSVPPFPEGIGGSNAKVAAGQYDADIRAWATKLKAAGWNTDRTVIRLGWENNGNWYQWSQSNGGSEAFKQAFRKFVTVSRSAGLTNVKWNWNLNKGAQAYNSNVSWTTGYPGSDVVDIIGIDSYDFWTPSFNDAQWQAQITGRNPGLQDVASFVRANGKQLALDEWGVVHDANGGNDNPFYIAKMFSWLKANADVLAYENTYDHDGAPSTFQHKLSDGDNPRAAAEYRKVYPNGWGG